jgi:hypothetical protein
LSAPSIVWLLILVFTEPGAPAPTVKITVTRSQLACEETRLAVQKGAAIPLQLAQCAPLDMKIVNDILTGRR